MLINDKRHNPEGVHWKDCVNAEIYIDPDGRYVMYCLIEGRMIDLGDASMWEISDYEIDDKFIPVKARLEIE